MEQAIESLLPSLATADLAARRYRTIPRLSRLRRRAMAPVKSNKKPCGASNHSPAKDCMILALVSGLNSAFSGLARCGRRFRCSFHLQLLPYNFPPPPCTYTPTLETETQGDGKRVIVHFVRVAKWAYRQALEPGISWKFAPRRGPPSVIPPVSMAPPEITKSSVHCTPYEGGKKSLGVKSKISWTADLK